MFLGVFYKIILYHIDSLKNTALSYLICRKNIFFSFSIKWQKKNHINSIKARIRLLIVVVVDKERQKFGTMFYHVHDLYDDTDG